jgi:hypothetical protein
MRCQAVEMRDCNIATPGLLLFVSVVPARQWSVLGTPWGPRNLRDASLAARFSPPHGFPSLLEVAVSGSTSWRGRRAPFQSEK